MFDVIGKRRWFYIVSLVLTIPGLVFILLTPVHGRRPPVHDRLHRRHAVGDPASRIRRSRPSRSRRSSPSTASRRSAITHRLRVHRDQDRADRARGGAASDASRRSAAPSGSPASASGVRPRRRRPPRAAPSPSASASAPRRASASAPHRARRRVRSTVGVAVRGARRQHRAARPTASSARSASRSRTQLGKIAEQNSLTTIGAVVSSDLHQPGPRPHRRRVARDRALDHLPLPRRQVRRHGAGLARSTTSIVVVGAFAILGTFFRRRDRRPVRDRDAHGHRLQRPRHDRRVRPRPREQGAPRRRAVRRRSSTTRSCRRSAARS